MAYANPNLLPVDASTFEDGTSSWTAENGGTSVSVVQSSVAAGTYAMQVSADSGTAWQIASSLLPVDPDETYVAMVPLGCDVETSGRSSDLAIEWYSDAQALISTSDVNTQDTSPDAGLMYLSAPVCSGTSPSSAAFARLRCNLYGLSAGDYVLLDAIYFGVAANPPGNLLTYSEYSFESGVPPFALTNLSDPARSGAYYVGNFSASFAVAANDVCEAQLSRLIPISAGGTYQLGYTLFADTTGASATGSVGVTSRITWYSGSGEEVGNALDQWYFRDAPADSYPAVTGVFTATAPAGATQARVSALWDTTNCDAAACLIDNFTFEVSTPLYTATTDDERGVITSTIYYSPDPDRYPGIDTFTLWRIGPDGTKTAVRGYGSEMVNVPLPAFPLVVEDYEAPLGSEVWYTAIYSASGEESSPTTLQTSLIRSPVVDQDHIWIKSPGLPAMNRQVVPEAPIEWQRAARSQTYTIVGRTNPIQVSGKRAGRVGALSALVWEADDNATLNRMLDAGTPLLIQAMPGLGIEGNTFVHVGDSTESPVSWNASEPIRRWTLGITEIDRPVGGVQGSALRTWQDINDNYVRWDDVYDAYDTWTEVMIG